MSSGFRRVVVILAISGQFLPGNWIATGAYGAQLAAAPYIVPDVLGLSAKDAKSALERSGLVAKFQIGKPAARPGLANTVYAVTPAPHTRLAKGAVVQLTLYSTASAGVRETGAPPATRQSAGVGEATAVFVPALMGSSAKDAKAVIKAVGLTPKFVLGSAPASPAAALTVYSQQPAAGAIAAAGQPIAITIHSALAAAANEPSGALAQGELASVQALPYVEQASETIDPRSGRLFVSVTDLIAPAGAIKLEVRRSLQVLPVGQGLLGSRWRLNWESRLLQSGNQAVIEADGVQLPFFWDAAANRFASASGDYLVPEAGRMIWFKIKDRVRDTFDEQGRLVARDLRNGNRIALEYDAQERLASITGPHNTSLQFRYDPSGRLAEIESPTGGTVRYSYTDAGTGLEAAPDDSSTVSHYSYGENGQLVGIKHPRLGATQIAYDGTGRVARRSWSDGTSERYEYDDATATLRYFDPAGQLTTTTWSADGLSSESTAPSGQKILMQNDTSGRPVAITGPTGLTSRFEYDPLGRTVVVDDPKVGTTRFQYLGDSSLPTVIEGPDGRRRTFEYDRQENLVRLTDSVDPTQNSAFAYGSDGQLVSLILGNGQRTTYTYDAAGQRDSSTDAAGNKWRYEYDLQGNLVRETDPLGGVTERTYDAEGRLTKVKDATSGIATYRYSQNGAKYTVTKTDPRGGESEFTYDARGRLVSASDAAKRTTRSQYDALGRLVRTTGPGGEVHTFEYDALGNQTRATNPLGAVSQRTYDALGNLVSLVPATGGAIRYEYSPTGRIVRETGAAGTAATYDYDADGKLLSKTDALGQSTDYEYTPEGRLAKVTVPGGTVVSHEYDKFGNITRTRRGAKEVSYQYNALGRCVKEKHSTGLEITYRHDAVGNLIGWNDNQGGGETVQYDAAGRAVATTNAAGATTKLTYDSAGGVTSATDALGHTKKLQYDAAGQLKQVAGASGNQANYEYDLAGRLAAIRHAAGGNSLYVYDSVGNPTKVVHPASGETSSTYDSSGRLVSRVDAKGQTTKFAYDEVGRLVEKQLADGRTVRYEYDRHGRLTRVDDGSFPVAYSFDQRGNLATIEYPALKRSLRYEFNDAGLKTRLIDSEGQVVEYTYDKFHRLSAIGVAGNKSIKFSYDARDRIASANFPNGVIGTWKFGPDESVTKLTYQGPSGKSVAGWTHAYDAAGNLVQTVEDNGRSVRYGYDANGQLVEETPGEGNAAQYAYLAGGNRGKKQSAGAAIEYRYDKADRLAQSGDESFAYDPNGNLIERKGPKGITRYAYDTENQLIQVDLPTGEKIQYTYAPTGERIGRRDRNGQTYYVTDGDNVLAELGPDLKPTATYVHGPGIDQPLVLSRGGQHYFFHADHLGSVSCLTDEQGAVAASYGYDAFGNLISSEGNVPNAFLYTGRERDAAAGLYYFRARYYDAAIGRFLSADSVDGRVDEPLTWNRYAYVLNSPLAYRDPTGHQTMINKNGVDYAVFYRGHDQTGLHPKSFETRNAGIDASRMKLMGGVNPNTGRYVKGDVHKIGMDGVLKFNKAGSMPHPSMIPISESPKIATQFAGQKGEVLTLHVPATELNKLAIPNPHNKAELEWVVPHEVPDHWVVKRDPVSGKGSNPPPRPPSSGPKPPPPPKGGGTGPAPPPSGTPSTGTQVAKGLATGGTILGVVNVGIDIAEGKSPTEIAGGFVTGAVEEAKWVGGGAIIGGIIGGIVGGIATGGVGIIPGIMSGAKIGAGAVGAGRTFAGAAATGERLGTALGNAAADDSIEQKGWTDLPPVPGSPADEASKTAASDDVPDSPPATGWEDLPPVPGSPADIEAALGPPNDSALAADDGDSGDDLDLTRARGLNDDANTFGRAEDIDRQLTDNERRAADARHARARQGGGGQQGGGDVDWYGVGQAIGNAIREHNQQQQGQHHPYP